MMEVFLERIAAWQPGVDPFGKYFPIKSRT